MLTRVRVGAPRLNPMAWSKRHRGIMAIPEKHGTIGAGRVFFMKPLLLFLAVVTPLWVFSQGGPVKGTEPSRSATEGPPNQPPAPNGAVPGRFQVVMLQAQGDRHLALRIDTFTGQTWTLQNEPREVKGNDGATRVTWFEHWKKCMEPEAMEWMIERETTNPANPVK